MDFKKNVRCEMNANVPYYVAPAFHLMSKANVDNDKIIQHILNVVSDLYNITIEDIFKKDKSEKFAFPRQVCCYFIFKKTTLSLKQTAETLERERTNVYNSIKVINRMMNIDEAVRKTIIDLDLFFFTYSTPENKQQYFVRKNKKK